MGNAAFLLIPIGVTLIGLVAIGLKLLIDRPKPYDEMNQFRRGLDALAPKSAPDPRRSRRGSR